MKKIIDAPKYADAISDVLQKTSDIGKKATESVQKSAEAISIKTKNDSYLRRMKKYNPVFPELFYSEKFNIPNMIVIVDDAVRRGIDVCEGSIGWLGNENGMEILYLYDEVAKEIGIQFIPTAACDAIYYVDSFDCNRFIRTDYIFTKAHEERIAELKHIAYSLGAKSCSIEISESNTDKNNNDRSYKTKQNATIGIEASASANAENNESYMSSNLIQGRICLTFEGSVIPKRPELKWFVHDDNIRRLIDMRFEDGNSIKSEILELSGSTSAAMSQKTACAIDSAISKTGIKVGTKASAAMSYQAKKESLSKLIFKIEF